MALSNMCFPPGENCFRHRKITKLIEIEKRIIGFDGPIDDGAGVALQKITDLAPIFRDQRMAQILSDRDGPESNQRMRPPARSRASGHGVVFLARLHEASDKIVRQERYRPAR